MYLTLDERGRFELSSGDAVEPRTFVHARADGELVSTYGQPHTYALDDYFYIIDLHYVRDGILYRGGIVIGGAGSHHRCELMAATPCLVELTLAAG